MKKKLFTYLLALITFGVFANKTIDDPIYGLNSIPGSITKIELLDDATILHFHIKFKPKNWIKVLKETRLVEIESGKEYFAIKTEGIPFNKKHYLDETGEIDYKVYFPKIPKHLTKIDFKEGRWFTYDLVLNNKDLPTIPKQIKGSWLQTNGSGLCDYIFNNQKALINKELWKYKSVKSKKNKYTLVLEKDGKEKIIKAKLEKDGLLSIKEDKSKKGSYTKTLQNNANYTSKSNRGLETPNIKLGKAIYSGVIKDYTPRVGIKTGMVYVNNNFTGDQEQHIVKIAEDGTFKVELSIGHPQVIFSRVFNNSTSFYISPGKETFHVINGKENLFMGDLAQVNTDLEKMKDIRINGIDQKTRENILQIKPEDFKAIYTKQHAEALQELETLTQTTFISKKALELKKLALEYRTLTQVLSYDMYSRSAKRNLKPEELKDLPNYKLDKTYLSEITPEILNNKKAIMANGYSFFINYFTFLDIFNSKVNHPITSNDVLTYLQTQNINIPQEQVAAVKANELLNTPEKQERQDVFNQKYGMRLNSFYRTNLATIQKIQKEQPNEDTYQILKEQLKNEGKLSPLDEEMLIAMDNITSPEEKAAVKAFQEKHGEALKEFKTKYSSKFISLSTKKYYESKRENMKEILGLDTSFVFDIFTLQMYARPLTTDLVPYSATELKNIKKDITNKDLANYIDIANNKTIETLEANKTKTGYHVNKVEKTEGDELFESMIAKFKGKVIYVDFWATWCGPCRSGIQRIAPLKEEMIDKDVVFLYISAPSSPEKTWKNAIPNIKGEHYRVTQDEWNYLKDKFKISGIPHYALVNKKGELVNPKLGHHSNSDIKKILEEELNKQ
ncbi:redoxin family protein [Wenyingzhuangia sp. chi5]|uniref:Redoxin family protein n=1 Tax=Wenyingzhuangia gilva TaxID=3057677 RepID=A0ABT8VSW8_9FLAO|nr:thioredoxin-like domain-containing protein [Wenyingzhuangia sp. chi5]MDO3695071.1 redoxin family protein [Wenyingzhuangia sp. chi5]